MIVTQDIAAGECLFVTPPTVGVEVGLLLPKKDDDDTTTTFEDVAMELLVDSMMDAIRHKRKHDANNSTINSFLSLMGAFQKQEQ